MITIATYLKFWGKDLMTIKTSKEIEKVLSPSAINFLHQHGFPTKSRIFEERKRYLENTTPFPELFLGEKIEKSIRSFYPYFEFFSFLSEIFEFHGKEFVKIGITGEDDLAVDINSGSVHCIDRSPPDVWPVNFPPMIQDQFINSGIEKLGLFLTAEFVTRQECIAPTRKYIDAIKSRKTKLRKEAEKEISQIIDNLEKEFIETDSQALTSHESFWRRYLREYRDK